MKIQEAIEELLIIQMVYANMRKEYQSCVEALQIAIEALRTAKQTKPQIMYYPQVDGITPSVIVKDEPQTKLCRECDDYAGDGMYCASNYIVYDFSTSRGNCESQPTTDCRQTERKSELKK